MKIKNKKKIFIIVITIALFVSLISIYILKNNSNNSIEQHLEVGYQEAALLGSHHIYHAIQTGFKTRDGGTVDSKVVVSLGDPPIGRKAETFKIDILESPGDGSEISVLSANIKEGETLYLDNNLKAGKYYQLGISKPDAKEGKQYTFNYKWTPDESELDIPRPYVG